MDMSSEMDPFIWGFVRGGSATNAVGLPVLGAYSAHAGHPGYALLMAGAGLLAMVLFVVNERRRPW